MSITACRADGYGDGYSNSNGYGYGYGNSDGNGNGYGSGATLVSLGVSQLLVVAHLLNHP